MDYKKLARSVYEAQNELRTNPQSFIPKLEEMLKHFKGTLLERPGRIALRTNEGAKAVKECIEVLKKTKPLCKLAFNDGLARACQDHVNDIGPKGITDHKGSDGSGLMDRVKRYLQAGFVGENIDFGSETGEEVVISLIVDDGVPSRGHRNNMLNPGFNMVGIACGYHKTYRHCTVLDYSYSSKSIGSSSSQKVKNSEGTNNLTGGYSLSGEKGSFGRNLKIEKMSHPKIAISKSPNVFMKDPHIFHQVPKTQPVENVKISVKTIVRIEKGRKLTKTITTYHFANGSTREEIRELSESVCVK